MAAAHKQHKTALTKQTGQSMTQYLVLTFMLAVGSLLTIGNARIISLQSFVRLAIFSKIHCLLLSSMKLKVV